MKLPRLLICALLALIAVIGLAIFLSAIFDQEEHAIRVIPLELTPAG